jgi:hypothetical protein
MDLVQQEVQMALTKVTMGLFKDFVNKVLAVMQNHSNIFLGTAKAATGTFVDFDIPAGVKRVTVMFDGVSTDGTSPPQVQIGSGAIITADYKCSNTLISSGVAAGAFNTGFGIGVNTGNWVAAFNTSGILTLNVSNTVCIACGIFGDTDMATGRTRQTAGRVSLSGPLNRIRITTVNGTDQFDAGTINVSWEF